MGRIFKNEQRYIKWRKGTTVERHEGAKAYGRRGSEALRCCGYLITLREEQGWVIEEIISNIMYYFYV